MGRWKEGNISDTMVISSALETKRLKQFWTMKLKQGLNYAHKDSKGHRQFYLGRNTSERAVDVELGSNLLITKLKLVIIKFFSSPAFAVAAPVCGIHFLLSTKKDILCILSKISF